MTKLIGLLMGLAAYAADVVAGEHLADGVVTQSEIRFGLVTYGPASAIMSHYGHSALVVFDDQGRSELYELATDSPAHQFHLPWYLTPQKLIYQSQTGALSPTLHGSFRERRDVQLRILNLTPAQQARLAEGIATQLRPEHQHFEFGVFHRNCTTRIRDLLDEATDGQLRTQLGTAARWTFREHSLRAFAAEPIVALALDLSVGRLADYTPTRWEESFHPEALAMALDQIRIEGESGRVVPLVHSTETLLDGSPELRMATLPPSYRAELAVTGAALFLLMLLANRRRWPGARQFQAATLAAFGLIGLLLTYLWLIGGERVASWNENLLLFNPLLLALVAARSVRWQRAVAALVLAGIGAAVLLKILPNPQANLGWIAFAGPATTYAAVRTLLNRAAGDSGRIAHPHRSRVLAPVFRPATATGTIQRQL